MKRVIKIQVEKKNGDDIVFNGTLALCHCFKNFSMFGIVIAFVVMVWKNQFNKKYFLWGLFQKKSVFG